MEEERKRGRQDNQKMKAKTGRQFWVLTVLPDQTKTDIPLLKAQNRPHKEGDFRKFFAMPSII